MGKRVVNQLRILVLQSGGTTPVINSTIAGILVEAKRLGARVYTCKGGMENVLAGSFQELQTSRDNIRIFYKQPGSALTGTSRVGRLPEAVLTEIAGQIHKSGFDVLINIGGNGTLQQSKAVYKSSASKFQVISCPKTVDNDLGDKSLEDVLFTPGFVSCIGWWNKSLSYLDIENKGAYEHEPVIVAQTFGRDTGYICAAIGHQLQRETPIAYGLPETGEGLESIVQRIKGIQKEEKRCILVVSEGFCDKELKNHLDKSGQKQYGSGVTTSAQMIADELCKSGVNSRSVIPTILQRVTSEASGYDRMTAYNQGRFSVIKAFDGKTGILVTTKKVAPLECDYIKYSEIPENYSRKLTSKFIRNHAPSDLYMSYISKLLSYEHSHSEAF